MLEMILKKDERCLMLAYTLPYSILPSRTVLLLHLWRAAAFRSAYTPIMSPDECSSECGSAHHHIFQLGVANACKDFTLQTSCIGLHVVAAWHYDGGRPRSSKQMFRTASPRYVSAVLQQERDLCLKCLLRLGLPQQGSCICRQNLA